MSKQMVEIEVPDGYTLIDYRVGQSEEFILINGKATRHYGHFGEYPILVKTPVSLHKFYLDAISLTQTKGFRYGQGMFNHLLTVNSVLAEKIRGTNCDPFQCESRTDPKFERFVEFIEGNWNK